MARRVPWRAVAVGGVALGVVGIAALVGRRKAQLPTAQFKRVALIGDSYAVGLGPELEKLLPNFSFEGHVGTNTSQWANHAAACGACGDWLAALRPTIVIVSLGVNDGSAPNPANYQTIVQALHGIGARVMWIEPPAAVNVPAVRRMIASLGVPTVPATQVPLAADGVHPAGTGYKTWAQEIAQVVSRAAA